jgi:ActR/RegA family two-component response regulator
VTPGASSGANSGTSSGAASAPTSVLVVEDDTTFRSTLARDLGSRGHSVALAGGVDDALAALAGGKFEVLLTDLRLGGRDGIDLLKRARSVAPSTRSILMSGFASARDYQRAIELGAVRVLCKPFSSAELNQAIEHARDCSQGYSGNIHGLSLIDVLQLYQFGRRSIAIRVVGGRGGEILLREGAFVHAAHGELTGERALISLLAMPSGVLRSETLPPSFTTTIDRPAQAVLLDCLRQLDEGGPEIAAPPPPRPGSRAGSQSDLDDPVEAVRYRLRTRWQHLIDGGPSVPDGSDVIGLDPAAGVAVRIVGHGEPEIWLEPIAGVVASAEQLFATRRGALQAGFGSVQLAVLWDRDQSYCFLVIDVATSVAGNAWFRAFATAVARGVLSA